MKPFFRPHTEPEWRRVQNAIAAIGCKAHAARLGLWKWWIAQGDFLYEIRWDGFEHCWRFDEEFVRGLTEGQKMVLQKWLGCEIKAIKSPAVLGRALTRQG